ncbi:putative lysophospholipase plb1 protein [Neofusicoccum parvum UCRNP2]|uniref:Lysophospholipase n=1 Tax=Botryosphaeria parva (strain UCR-NP2) TaxID=1287680 RepID=R1GPU3_BOTPV|nr:putative lysophospholipase plb1 protein [Neofusicoccum parvum UCRNP2]
MKLDTSLASASLLLSAASASVVIPRDPTPEQAAAVALAAVKRGSPQAPNGYTPAEVACPSSRPTLRNALSLSSEETAWLEKRRNNTVSPMRELLGRLNITGFDSNSYIENAANNVSALPNIGIAVSGGGYRALMNGAGAAAAFDSRTPNSTNTGHLGGLLQAATYFAGLSGGGWLVSSLYGNNFTSVQDIINTTPEQSGSLWQFGNSIFEGPDTGGIQVLSTAQYYSTLEDQVSGKRDAGFDTSITDYWGRALAFQLLNASSGGPGYTYSSISDDSYFQNGDSPMPILVADGREPGQLVISSNTTNFEFNPWEMGSYDPTVFGFVPLRYVGSNFSAGLGEDNNDIADWSPNPFYNWSNETNPSAQSKRLTLVDGGEDLQNIPFNPLIQPLRNVDVIFAVDSSADTVTEEALNWPNGTAMVATYERSLNASMGNGTIFPSVPDQNTFVNLGLNSHPTMFGCDASNFSSTTPLVVYIPNSPYIYHSNVSTYTMSYNNTERNAIIENGYDVATMGNGTVDPQWPTCVGCAIMSRSWNRTGTTVPDVCTDCFNRYCWNGTVNSTTPNPYVPTMALDEINVQSAAGHFMPTTYSLVAAVAASLAFVL